MTISTKTLEIAQSQIGVMEEPPGSNKGPMVDQYLASVGLGPGFSWCIAFAHWCSAKAAAPAPSPLVKTGGVLDAWHKTDVHHRLTKADALANPERLIPGSVFVLDLGHGEGHAGVVESVDPHTGHLATVEGNSNNDGSREGIGVFHQTKRSLHDADLVGFILIPG